MYKYLEIVEDSTNEVACRMDITNCSERQIERLENGVHINMNHDKFHTREMEYEEKQDTNI